MDSDISEIKKYLVNLKLSTKDLKKLTREVKELLNDPTYVSETDEEEEEEVSQRDINKLIDEKIEVRVKDGFYYLD